MAGQIAFRTAAFVRLAWLNWSAGLLKVTKRGMCGRALCLTVTEAVGVCSDQGTSA